jgi:hypothetical protein
LHWDNTSGGVGRKTSHPALFGYVMCDEAIEGAVSHTCRHGPPPHRIKVCIPKVCNKEGWKLILAKAPPSKTPEQRERDRQRVIELAEAMGPIHKEMQLRKQEEMLRGLLGKDHLKAVDKWIAKQNDPAMDRPDAIRRLVEIGLRAKK